MVLQAGYMKIPLKSLSHVAVASSVRKVTVTAGARLFRSRPIYIVQ